MKITLLHGILGTQLYRMFKDGTTPRDTVMQLCWKQRSTYYEIIKEMTPELRNAFRRVFRESDDGTCIGITTTNSICFYPWKNKTAYCELCGTASNVTIDKITKDSYKNNICPKCGNGYVSSRRTK